ncbi:hypothetical protein [Pseudomonas phage Rollin]|nr:hypothetical protein [Pseudomonas phage Rollin]
MIPPVVRLTTVTGAWLFRRAKQMAAKLVKRRAWSDVEVVDGYVVRATRAASKATAVILDSPGLVVTNPTSRFSGYFQVEARDGYNSQVPTPPRAFSLPSMVSQPLPSPYYAFGFTSEDSNWLSAVPLPEVDYYYLKRDKVRFSALLRSPILSLQMPLPVGSIPFVGVQTHGTGLSAAPGYWWNRFALEALTGGYGPARIANMFPLEFTYQGEAPVSASVGQVTLVVIPVVVNGATELPDAAVAWGTSGVYFTLMQADLAGGPAIVLWSRLWTPDEHSVTFFHNGVWEAFPDLPQYASLLPPKPPTIEAWDEWWDENTSGGSRPNWTDCMTVSWFNDKFVVSIRVAAFNGTYNPPDGEIPESYRMAGGTAHVRFEVGLGGSFTLTEVSHEVWNAPEQYNAPSYNGLAPYDVWVDGILPDETATSSMPAASLATDEWLFEAVLQFDVERRNPREVRFATGPWNWFYPTDKDSDRLVYTVTQLDADGNPLPPVEYTIVFGDIECGLDMRRTITDAGIRYRYPPIHYNIRACDSQFAIVGRNTVAFLARPGWEGSDADNELRFVIIDVLTGVVNVLSNTGIEAVWADDHMICPHLDCIQRADPTNNLEGVYMVTSQASMKSRISKDSGVTWDDYITDHEENGSYSVAAYYVGNAYGGGSTTGRAVR